jgi:neutral ceramidase
MRRQDLFEMAAPLSIRVGLLPTPGSSQGGAASSHPPRRIETRVLLAAVTLSFTLSWDGAAIAIHRPAQAATLRVGAARVDITPPAPPGNTIRDRLYASAIVIESGTTRAVLIGADQIAFSEAAWTDVTARLTATFKIPPAHVLTTATHTHSDGRFGVAPPLDAAGRGGAPAAAAPPSAPPQPSALAGAVFEAVRAAIGRLQPARVGYGAGVSNLNVNRDAIHPETKRWYQGPNLTGESDKTLAVLSFVTPEGKPIAFFVNYAMHPINYYLRGIVSADFPGEASRYLEGVYGDDLVVVWSQGAEGDQNPLYSRPSTALSAARRGGGPRDEIVRAEAGLDRWIRAMGAVLGEEIIRVNNATTSRNDGVRIWGGQTIVICPGRTRLDNAREGVPGQYEDGPPVNIRVGLLTIGTTAIASVNAEIYTGIGTRIKARSPLAHTIVTALANGSAGSGYIPTEDAFNRYTFQVLGSRLKPGCAEDGIVTAAVNLLSEAVR